MKRIAIAAVAALVVLAAAGTAFAAVNTYKATNTFTASKGTASKPAPITFDTLVSVAPVTAGDRTAILHQLTTQIDGVKLDTAGFPTCSAAKINAAASDAGCPKKALVASGAIKATLGPPGNFAASQGAPCDPELDVWNGGGHKLIFFFLDTASHPCLGGQIHTDQVQPWTASDTQVGSKLDVTIPIPETVNDPLGASGNVVGSLSYVRLHWVSETMGSKHSLVSVGCSGKRGYTFGFKASLPTTAVQSTSLKGSASCG